jgi:hypothetical protein
MYQTTSREAFKYIRQSGKLNLRQQQVFDILTYYPNGLTDAQIGLYLHLPINCVTPRRGELAGKGLIEKIGIKVSFGVHSAHIWRVKKKEEIKTEGQHEFALTSL